MDSKNIKDYLHLYLGCPCLFSINYGTQYENLSVHRLDGIVRSRVYVSSIENGGGSCEIDKIKLILRPLSDMTEEEANCFYSFGGSRSIVNPKYAINQIFGANLFYEGYNRIQIAHLTQHLLSNGFDLFGLIDSGLAIKKSD